MQVHAFRGGFREGRVLSLADEQVWLQEGNSVFRVDLAGPTLGPSFTLGGDEKVAALEGNVAVIETADGGVRGMEIMSGDDVWRLEPDRRPYLERGRRFSIRWWYESTEHQTRVRRLDLSTGRFGQPHVLDHDSFAAPTLYSWMTADLLAAGRGRDVYFVHADGREPEQRRLPAEPGADPRFIFPFAGTWYVQGTGEDREGAITRLVPLDPGRPTLTCNELVYPSIATGDRLLIATGSWVYVWETTDEQPTETYLGPVKYGGAAVAAGPYAAVLAESTLHVQGPAGSWSMYRSPGEVLVGIDEHDGSPTLIMSGVGLVLCPIAEMAALGPGPHALPIRTIQTPAPEPPYAEVTFVGQTTKTGIAMHPQFGRLTFDASAQPEIAKGDRIEVIERAGGRVEEWQPAGAGPAATLARDDILPAPDSIGPAPTPAEPEPFVPSRMLERWRIRADDAGVETPALLARVFAAYDRGPIERSAIERLFVELDPGAELDADVVELLAEVGEHRRLVGFARDVEGKPIGLVPGDGGVYQVDDGELWQSEESFAEWFECRFESLADDGAVELIARLRDILELAPPEEQ